MTTLPQHSKVSSSGAATSPSSTNNLRSRSLNSSKQNLQKQNSKEINNDDETQEQQQQQLRSNTKIRHRLTSKILLLVPFVLLSVISIIGLLIGKIVSDLCASYLPWRRSWQSSCCIAVCECIVLNRTEEVYSTDCKEQNNVVRGYALLVAKDSRESSNGWIHHCEEESGTAQKETEMKYHAQSSSQSRKAVSSQDSQEEEKREERKRPDHI